MADDDVADDDVADDDLPDLVGWLGRVAKSKTFLNGVVYAIIASWVVVLGVALGFGPEKTGQIGDTFGALSSLFSGLALLGVFYAVLLERRQLAIARRDASDSEKARQKAETLLARQAEALLVSAQLNAVNYLLESTPGSSDSHVRVVFDSEIHMIPRTQILRQYIRILLYHAAVSHASPSASVPSGASMVRRYVLNLTRNLLVQFDAAITINATVPDARWVACSTLVNDLKREMGLLLGQSGITDSSDFRFAEFSLMVLKETNIPHTRASDPRDEDELVQVVRAAIEKIEARAASGAE